MSEHDVSGEARDERGRWTAGASGLNHMREGHPMVSVGSTTNVDAGKMVAERAAAVAKNLGFPVEKMTVTDADHTFELNGTQRFAAGLYRHNSDTIELAAHRLTFMQDDRLYPNGIAGVTAHEIMHAKFEALQKDYRAEFDALRKDPEYLDTRAKDFTAGARRDFMKADGTLSDEAAKRFPLYQAYTETMIRAGGIEGFAKTDGVSGYSKDYWTEWANGKAQTDTALHETLAEIARLRYEHGVKYDVKSLKQIHDAKVVELKKMGAEWTPEHEAEWRKNSKIEIGFMRYKRGEVDGKKVYFATTKGSPDRLSRAWSDLYNLVESNWKRRNKK